MADSTTPDQAESTQDPAGKNVDQAPAEPAGAFTQVLATGETVETDVPAGTLHYSEQLRREIPVVSTFANRREV